MSVDIIFSFSDRDQEAARELKRHLTPSSRTGRIKLWDRSNVLGGDDPDQAWQANVQTAQIIILLVSADLDIDRDSDISDALAQRTERNARVIPVLWRSVDIKHLRFKELRMVPDGRPVSERKDRDQAWVEVVQGIGKVVDSIIAEGGERPAVSPVASAAPTVRPMTSPVQTGQSIPVASPPAVPLGSTRLKILFMGANPSDTIRLRLPEERREIDRRIQLGEQRDRFELDDAWAVTPEELGQTLLRYKPGILHFSGHGSAQGEIYFNNENGKAQSVPTAALASLFKIFAAQGLRCVVLNACYSETQAAAIAAHVDCVVGIDGKLSDRAANAFTAGFYSGLAAGQTVQTAFDLGCVQIAMLNLSGADQPKLRGGPGVILSTLRLT